MSWIISIFTGFSLRTWLFAAAITAFALWSGYLYGAGYSAADAMWRARNLESKIAKLELELKVQKDADAAEDKSRTELTEENDRMEKLLDEYLKELKARPDSCLLGPDAERLQ